MSPASDWLEQQRSTMDASLADLVNVNSFTGHREGGQLVGSLLVSLFEMPGLTVERVPSERFADHLVFSSQGTGGPIALVGHFDTVFPPGTFEGYRVDGGLRRGPGVLDMKGGLVVIAFALKAIAQTVGLARVPSLRVVLVSDEEVGSPEGQPLLRARLAGCTASLVFESGRANDAIVTERKGTGSAFVTATGKAAHAGNAYFEGSNSIWAMSRFVDAVQQLSDAERGVTVNVGVIQGGTSKNTVPAQTKAELDLRFPTQALADQTWGHLHDASHAHGVPGATVEVVRGPGRAPMEKVAGTAALVAKYAACARRHGLAGEEAPRQGGGSDGNTTANMGIATIDALGPRGRGFHTHDEYIEFETLISRARALADFLVE